jgi:NADP-dependent 3-hydroxy acid dehydrogenase YdfG
MESGLERWRGRVAVVTGASSGIGAAIAIALGKAGMQLALVGRNRPRLTEVARRSRAPKTRVITCDQTVMRQNTRIFAEVIRHWGGVDVLVNCAGMRGGVSLLRSDWAELDGPIDLNVRAALWCMREAVTGMRGRPESAIINVSSMVGHRVLPGAPAMYAASKHALRVLTDGFRAEVVQQRLPIKVALISPGLTDTPWHRQPGSVRAGGRPYPHAPLRPEDIAAAVCQVLSAPRSVQITDILLRSSEQVF